jgi:hypothetical protein
MNAVAANKEADSLGAGGADWKFALLGALPRAPRILTAATFLAFAKTIRPDVSSATSRLLVGYLIRAQALRRVTQGTYLNRRALPPAELYEAAPVIRTGAVLSLNSVLGELGVINNPSRIVTCILPTSKLKSPKLGELKTEAGMFRFYGLAQRFFPANAEDERELLQPGRPCTVFRAEVAILQWLHLASLKRSTLGELPLDVDLELLDLELLARLAERFDLREVWGRWYARANDADFGTERAR